MAQVCLHTAYGFNDYVFVARLGDDAATAALSACFAITVVMYGLSEIIAVGAHTVVAQLTGGKALIRRKRLVKVAFVSALLLGSLVSLGGAFLARPIAESFQLDERGTSFAAGYLRIILLGFPALSALHLVTSVFRALGHTVAPVIMEGSVLALNTLANGWLVLGWFGGPSMGVEGAALATVLSCILPCAVAWVLLFRTLSRAELGQSENSNSAAKSSTIREDISEILKIGIPASLIPILYGIVFLGLIRICGAIGQPAQSGLGAALRGVEWVGWAACIGFNVSASVAVGQCIGAGQGQRARTLAWYATLYGALFVEVIGIILALTAPLTLRLVSEDPQTQELGALYLYWVGPLMFLVGTEITLQGVLVGAGRTMTSMKIIGVMDLLRVPIATLLVFGWSGLGDGLYYVLGMGPAPAIVGSDMKSAFLGVTLAIAISAGGKALLCLYAVHKLDFDQLAIERRARLGLDKTIVTEARSLPLDAY